MSTPEAIALSVASLAAVSSLLNALVGLWNAWRDNRRLTISIEPDPWAQAHPELADLVGECIVVVKIMNRARTPNSLAQIRYLVDSKEQKFTLDPPDFLTRAIAPLSMTQAVLKLQADQLPATAKTVKFTVVPVRGKARTFTFPKGQVLPEC